MITDRSIRTVTQLLTLGVLLLAAFGTIRAHGIGLTQVVNTPNGPYLVSVWTDPDPLREDETHVVVAVMDPETRAPLVENLTVSVRLDSTAASVAPVTAVAHSDNSTNQLLYVVEFNNRVSEGAWEATVIVDGPQGMASDVSFPIEIGPARGFNWLWLGIGGLGLVAGVWLVLSARKTPATGPARAAQSASKANART